MIQVESNVLAVLAHCVEAGRRLPHVQQFCKNNDMPIQQRNGVAMNEYLKSLDVGKRDSFVPVLKMAYRQDAENLTDEQCASALGVEPSEKQSATAKWKGERRRIRQALTDMGVPAALQLKKRGRQGRRAKSVLECGDSSLRDFLASFGADDDTNN